METLKPEVAEFQALKDLKPMLAAEGPCLSAYMQLSTQLLAQNPRANALEWKELLRGLESKAEQFGEKGRELLASVSGWSTIGEPPPQTKSVGVFRSPEVFRVAWMESAVANRAYLGPRFHIRPLMQEITRDRDFYILALSQKDVRLIHCTTRNAEEVPFPAGIVSNYDAWMNTAQPDHVRDNKSTAGPSTGHMRGVMFGTTAESEHWAEYLAHFLRQIDRGVNEALRDQRDKKTPLVLAAVEYMQALYRTINTYPHLADECVQGAPNGLKAGEMHARALDALERCYEKQIENKLAEWNHKVGGGASNRLKEVLTAAHEGRVVTLLVSDSLQTTGVFDEATYKAVGRETGTPNDADLVNDAVLETILHAGQVFVAPNNKMPNGAPVAAIYRF